VTPIDTFRTLNVDTSGGRGTIFSLKASNALGWSRVWMGYHEAATYCMDVNLGEDLLPPLPPSAVWDLRLVDPRGFDAACFDQGTYRDYRPPGNTDQTDTFLVKIQAGKGGYPVSLQWPNLSALIEGDAWLRDAFGGVLLNVNMKESTSVTLHHDALNSLMIFLSSPSETPLPVAGLDSVAFYQGTSAVAAGYVNPNGFATEAWFEYGTSDQFGSTTDTMSISGLLPIANLLGIATGMEPGSAYHFRVVARNANGTYYGPDVILAGGLSDVENPPQVPSEFLLSQNYPNPFNPTTSIRYSIPEAAEVSLVVYDLHGREVEILVDGFQPAGVHEVVWHGSGSVSSGVYYYRLTAGSSSQTRKLLYIR
jgi:hypothetical protein